MPCWNGPSDLGQGDDLAASPPPRPGGVLVLGPSKPSRCGALRWRRRPLLAEAIVHAAWISSVEQALTSMLGRIAFLGNAMKMWLTQSALAGPGPSKTAE